MFIRSDSGEWVNLARFDTIFVIGQDDFWEIKAWRENGEDCSSEVLYSELSTRDQAQAMLDEIMETFR